MRVYILPMQAAPDKGKTGQKAKRQKRQGIFPTDSFYSSASLQATEEGKCVFREPSGVQSPQGTGLSELLLNKPISFWIWQAREQGPEVWTETGRTISSAFTCSTDFSADCPKVIWQTVASFLYHVNFWTNSTCIPDGLKICIHCHCFCSAQRCLPMSRVYDVCSKCFSVDIFCDLSEDKLH